MNVRQNMITFALAAFAVGMTTTQAGAETRLAGSFELPEAVYLGDTLLQPGQYAISMSAEVRDLAPAIHVSGEGVSKTFLAMSKPNPDSHRNCLQIRQVDGAYVVSAFQIGLLGKSYSLGVSKSVRNRMLRAGSGPAVTVPISTAAGF